MAKLRGVSCSNSLITHYGSLTIARPFRKVFVRNFCQKLEYTVKRGAKYKWKGKSCGKNLQYVSNPYDVPLGNDPSVRFP